MASPFRIIPCRPQVGSRRSKRGFALLITITLLAFLVLLLVSLASLTRVETQVAGNNQSLAQARQNALMALNIALGQLQKFAGPDQRTTASADLAGNTAGVRLTAGTAPVNTTSVNAVSNGLVKVQAGTRYWTGIWGNSNLTAAVSGNGNSFEKTPSPVLLNWLVSGNETASFTHPDLTAGQITASNGGFGTTAPVYNPSYAVTPALTTGTTATDTLSINNNPAVLLVGANTAGSIDISPAETAMDRYVAAPLVTLSSDQSPGFSGSNPVGHYAYWVGDEGVKARLNLTDPNAAHTASATDELARIRLMSAPRSGVEAVADFSASTYEAWSQSTATTPPLASVLSLEQARLLDTATITPAVTGKHVHDLTTQTYGLEADTLNGGLRRDLTAYFSQATLPTWTGTNGAASGTGTSIIPSVFSPNYQGTAYVPRWDVLRDFYRLYNDNQVSGAVPAQAASLTKTGLAPQLLQLRMIIGVNATNGQMMKGLFTPLIALGNPYSTPIKLNGLKVQFWLADPFAGETWPNPVERMSSIGADPSPAFNTGRFMKVFTYEGDTANGYGALTGAVTFTLPTTITLQPGEAKLFSLNANYDAAGASIPLVAGEAADFAGTYNYVYRTSTRLSPTTGGGGQNYKFTEGDTMTAVVVKILDSTNQTVLKVEGLNIDASTNSYGLYWEPNGATNTDRVIAAYNFDLGDPGVSSSLADPALRAYTDFNPRAAVTRRTNATLLSGSYFRYSPNTGDLATANTLTPSVPPTTFTSNLDPIEWGRHGQSLSPVLYDLPQGSMPVLSMGQLQQANLTADDIALNVGHQPALAVGNSYSTPFLNRNLTVQARSDTYTTRYNTGQASYNTTRKYYDIAYLLNTSLWDGSFFSTVPASGATFSPVNPRLLLTDATSITEARDGTQVAAHTLIQGAFNINSTSVDAWTSLLAGMRALPALPVSGATANTKTSAFPRSIRQPSDATTVGSAVTAVAPSGDKADAYSGFRRLTDDQIRTLAQAIVKQVRLRGPFVSLSHFVNRALVPAASDTSGLGFAGALQSAIDSTTINDFANVTATADKLVIPASHTYYADSTATDFALNAPRAPQRSTGIPGWLTQADILQAVGSVLASRSDTFLVRTYGDVQNPATGVVTGRAWCEAVVQRLPEYVDNGTGIKAPETAPSATNATNQTFGRRFRVVSFRWLSPADI
jgi:Tfp pilus assembly protein PilX